MNREEDQQQSNILNLARRKFDLDSCKLPQHIAVIMDGNGRWAQLRGLARVFGHRKGADRVREIVENCGHLGIKALTLFAFSDENWSRPRAEVSAIMGLLDRYILKERDNLFKNNVQLRVIGATEKLPEKSQALLASCVESLSVCSGLRLNLALSYGGKSDILRMVQTIATKCVSGQLDPKFISFDDIESNLMSAGVGDVDLLIRTSGEQRISNFLLWQCAYSELFFSDTLWPDFSSEDLCEALVSYQSRQRRFGAVLDPAEKKPVPEGASRFFLKNFSHA